MNLNDLPKENFKRNSSIVLENVAELSKALENLNDFDFDIFKFDEITQKNPLYFYSFELFGKYDFFKNNCENKFKNFIHKIIEGYPRSNSYHNDLHATDVLQSCVAIAENGNFIKVNFY